MFTNTFQDPEMWLNVPHAYRIRACYKVADVPLSMTAYIHTKLSKRKWGLEKIRPQTPML